MREEQSRTHNAVRRPFGLARGESLVASGGLLLAVILLLGLAASAWTSADAMESAAAEANARTVAATADVLAEAASVCLAENELTALRRIVSETARAHGLSRCRISLGDGSVLAASGRFEAADLPERWPAVPKGVESIEPTGRAITRVVRVPPHGSFMLEVEGGPERAAAMSRDLQLGVGLVGAAALSALLLAYRWLRRRVRAIGMIRDALLALAQGEVDGTALRIDERFGPEAEAWNRMLEEREELRTEVASHRAREAMAVARRDSSDLAGACDAMSQGMLVVDDSSRVIFANGAAAIFLGLQRDGIVDSHVADVLPDDDLADRIQGVASGRIRQRQSMEIQRELDGNAGVLRVHMRPVRRDDSGSAVVLIEDITQQRIADKSRKEFVEQATHELRTPLTHIRLYVEEILDDPEGDAARRAQSLNVINQEVRRLERIVDDMLQVSVMESGSINLRIDDVRFETLFKELEEDFRAQAEEKGITLNFDLPPKLPVIQGDRDKLLLAIHNVVGNALKYTPEGGTVTVKFEEEEDGLRLQVTDTGIGISQEDLPRIFNRFVRATDARINEITGTGLGLPLALDVVRLHGGDIAVESEIDHGSTFTLTLPAKAA